MTILTVQIGQCGNQLGYEFYDCLYRHINLAKNEQFKSQLIDMYFDEEYTYENNLVPVIEFDPRSSKSSFNDQVHCMNNYIARSILIDMEPKVIERCFSETCSERIGTGQVKRKSHTPKYRLGRIKSFDNLEREKRRNTEEGAEKQNYSCGFKDHYEPPNPLIRIIKNKKGSTDYVDSSFEYTSKDNEENENEEEEIDTFSKNEKKKIIKKNKYISNGWKYNECNYILGQSGSGNNWSFGFNIHAKNICEHFLNLINKELERNEKKESIDNFLLLHSLAGGSGSGISSYLSYLLKDEYPKINLTNICIVPYMFGEISVQSLNSVLCISSLYDVSDALIFFENDKFELMCKRITNENINTDEINKYISLFLTYTIGLPLDVTSFQNENFRYSSMMNSILSDLCPHPNYKLLSTRYLPQVLKENMKFEQNTFNMLLKRMHKMLIKGCVVDSEMMNRSGSISEASNLNDYFGSVSSRHLTKHRIFYRTVHIPIYLNEILSNSYVHYPSNSILLKKTMKNYSKMSLSSNAYTAKKPQKHKTVTQENIASPNFIHNNIVFNSKMIMRGQINENLNFDLFKNNVLYNNKCVSPLEIYIDENKQFGHNTISMISNCLTHIPTLKKILQNAKMLYSANAYIYQYNNYGVTHEQIHNSLMCVEQVINSYENLSCE